MDKVPVCRMYLQHLVACLKCPGRARPEAFHQAPPVLAVSGAVRAGELLCLHLFAHVRSLEDGSEGPGPLAALDQVVDDPVDAVAVLAGAALEGGPLPGRPAPAQHAGHAVLDDRQVAGLVELAADQLHQGLQHLAGRTQLAAERVHQRVLADSLMRGGVTLIDPARLDIRGAVTHGMDVHIEPNVILEGRVVLGNNVRIGANCQLKDCEIGDNTVIKPNSLIDDAKVGAGAEIGPFARLRPGTVLADSVHIGNFVETKKAVLGKGSKANHLAYLGDAEIGSGVNIGAGTITCNYDGVNKHLTTIGDNAFIGTNTSLIAPVTVGAGATTGAGSAISKDVPENTLAVARGKQVVIESWQRPVKK